MVQPLWKAVRRFLRKLKIELPDDSDSYPKVMKSGPTGAVCTPKSTEALFMFLYFFESQHSF